jgi:hypothetical protein
MREMISDGFMLCVVPNKMINMIKTTAVSNRNLIMAGLLLFVSKIRHTLFALLGLFRG